MKAEQIYPVVKELIGNINPAGISEVDEERFENLKEHITVIRKLLKDVDSLIIDYSNHHEASVKRAVNHAEKCFKIMNCNINK